eukprot:14710792-Alexandrium_andersonii.AAC.1
MEGAGAPSPRPRLAEAQACPAQGPRPGWPSGCGQRRGPRDALAEPAGRLAGQLGPDRRLPCPPGCLRPPAGAGARACRAQPGRRSQGR